MEKCAHVGVFHNFAQVHDRYLIAHAADYAQVVSDKHDRHFVLLLQAAH